MASQDAAHPDKGDHQDHQDAQDAQDAAHTSSEKQLDDRIPIAHRSSESPTSESGAGKEAVVTPKALRRAFSLDPAVEKNLVRKMDWNIVPLVSVLYLLAFIDRSNIGNARTAGMSTDLDLYGNRYTWFLNIFYIPYIIFEVGVIGWKIVPPHIWATIMVTGWGIAATCQAGAFNWSGEMAARFFMGAFEAAYGPGVPYLLSFFYLRHELGFRSGLFLSAAPLASCFAGALAYGITSGHAQLAPWRLLFLVEGLATLVLVPFVFFYLPDSPEKAKFLNKEESEMARARTIRQVGTTDRGHRIIWKEFFIGLADAKVWFTAFMYFSCNVSFASLPVFLPTILNDMGFTAINAQGLTAPPYFLAWIVTFSSCWVADRTQQRGLTIVVLACIGGVGYVLLATVESVGVRYFGVFLAASGVFPSIANILSWVLNNQGSDSRRSVGIAVLNIIGQCGPLLGTNVFPTTDGPRYIKGFSICAAFTFFTAILAISLRTLLAWENKKLDQKYGTRKQSIRATAASELEGSNGAETSLGEENYGPNFRYVL